MKDGRTNYFCCIFLKTNYDGADLVEGKKLQSHRSESLYTETVANLSLSQYCVTHWGD